MGILLLGAPPVVSGLSGRNIINIDELRVGTTEYPLINHMLGGADALSPNVGDFTSAGLVYPNVIDANGWPNQSSASGNRFGGGFFIPDPANFGGPYTLDFVGNGRVSIIMQNPVNATFVTSSPVNCSVFFNGSGALIIEGTGGASIASIQVTISTTAIGPQSAGWTVDTTGGSGFFVKNVRFYRTVDATDLAAGKVWRTAYKQPIVNLCPSAIRFMNILGGNNDFNCRFENRTLPTYAGFGRSSNWTASPVYASLATGTNQYACVAAVPTASNPKNTPASMVHGEIATMQFTNGFVRCTFDADGAGPIGVTGITNANPGVVTTNAAHSFSTGDIIGHYFPDITGVLATLNGTTTATVDTPSKIHAGAFVYGPGIPAGTTVASIVGTTLTLSSAATISGTQIGLAFRSMKKLNHYPCKITVVDSTHYSLQTVAGANLDTTSFGAFSFSSDLVRAYQFVSLQVGSGNDRIAYPITLGDGATSGSFFGTNMLRSNDYKTFYFDKTVSAQTDSSGNPIMGCWMMDSTPSQTAVGHAGDYPIEVCVALINELNAMSPAHTIGMWMNIPVYGLSSMDPDYTTASDWAVNAVDVVMNPSSTVRVSGYSALGYSGSTQLNQPNLIVEYSNELWRSGANNSGLGYLLNRGAMHFGTTIIPYSDWQDLKALKSTCWARDVTASNPPGLSRTYPVLGMWGSPGFFPASFGGNWETTFGGNVTANPVFVGDWYTNDALVTGGSWGSPIDNHKGVTPATYFDPSDAYMSGTGTGSFTDDSAMFSGTSPYSSPNQAQALTNFVNNVVSGSGAESPAKYVSVMGQFAAAMPAGKVVLNYEGGTNWQTSPGSVEGINFGAHTLTAADSLFMIAAINSPQWATAQVNFFNDLNAIPKCFMPSLFFWIQSSVGNQRWAYCTPDSYATIAGTPTEGAALTVNSPVWIAMGNRNQALPN